MGSCLTLTLVLFASLTPQPATAGVAEPVQRSPQSVVLRSAVGGEIALGYALLLDSGSCALVARLPSLDSGDTPSAAALACPAALPAAPSITAQPTRAP